MRRQISGPAESAPGMAAQWQAFWATLLRFPWKITARTLRERFEGDQLALTASSLTFTTTLALVPVITVALAVFTAFPIFSTVQGVLQKWLVESLIPDHIARQVLSYLTQFSGKASKLGTVGVAVLLVTALMLILTIDRTLNRIWRVRRRRPLGQKLIIYWSAISLGPLLLGASLSLTSYAVSASAGLVGALPGGVKFLFGLLEFALVAAGMAALYRYVPNTHVKWSHAWAGGVLVSVGIELAKKLLGLYLGLMPTYSAVYGAFATLPILLVWIYVAWVIVLLGAVVAAYLPSVLAGVARQASAHGWQFQLALETLRELHRGRDTDARGLTGAQLAAALQVDPLQLEPVLEALAVLDWASPLAEIAPTGGVRYVLLASPDSTALAPLMDLLLLARGDSTENLWQKGRWSLLTLRDVL